jgi:hypothetical protein
VNRQSNLKHTKFKPIKIIGPDMSGLRLDIYGLHRICPIKQEHTLRKSRSGGKTMNLDPDKFTTSNLNTIELRKIKGTTRSKLNYRNKT